MEIGDMNKYIDKIKMVFIYFLSMALFIFSCGQDSGASKDKQSSRGNVILHIYLARHAEAYKNLIPLPDLSSEKLDSLTEKGLDQARALGHYLKDKNISVIYSSPTGRTRQTAEIIRQKLEIPAELVIDAKFASLQQGLTPDGKPVSWAWRVEQWKKGIDARPFDGESMADGQRRLVSRLESLSKDLAGESILIVTHGDICTTLLARAAGTDIADAYKLHDVATGSVSEIIITEVQWHLSKQNIIPIFE